uniref:Uncharacterized protein n=1 Tax=Timema bartmani TaxID=61472 RepID=A0A7R9F5U1_9NEOP|nr:unnamed protein product [Timema bartmani]
MLVLKQFPGKLRNRDRENSSWLVAFIDTLKLEMNTASQKHGDEMYLLKQQNEEMTNINVELMNELAKLRDQIKHHEVQISKSERRVDAAQKEVDQCKEVIKVLREKMELDNKRNNERGGRTEGIGRLENIAIEGASRFEYIVEAPRRYTRPDTELFFLAGWTRVRLLRSVDLSAPLNRTGITLESGGQC